MAEVRKELEEKKWRCDEGVTVAYRFSFGKVTNTFPITATVKVSHNYGTWVGALYVH